MTIRLQRRRAILTKHATKLASMHVSGSMCTRSSARRIPFRVNQRDFREIFVVRSPSFPSNQDQAM